MQMCWIALAWNSSIQARHQNMKLQFWKLDTMLHQPWSFHQIVAALQSLESANQIAQKQ